MRRSASRQDRRTRLRPLLALAVGATLTAFAVAGYAFDALRSMERSTIDARFSLRGVEAPPRDLVVVQVDDRTFSDLDLQWPFPRSRHGKLVDRLARDGARVIAYDLQFSEPTVPAEDETLLRAVLRAGNVVLGTTEVSASGEPNIFGGGDVLQRVRARGANANLPADPGGVERRMPYAAQGLKSFGVVVAERTLERAISRGELDEDPALIDFHGPPGTIPAVSFSRALNGQTPPGFFRGKIVVVGASAPSLQDKHRTSTSGHEFMSGPELQANAVSTALRGFPLHAPPGVLAILATLVLGMVGPLVSLRRDLVAPLLTVATAAAAYAVIAQMAFERGLVLTVVYPLAAACLSALGIIAVHAVSSAFERERVREIFARFVPESVVETVLAEAGGVRLGGVEIEGTVLFSDLRGFTTYSESTPAPVVIEVLNEYLTEMSNAILDHGGTLVTFMGDGIMALFGGPLAQADHADRAVEASHAMLGRLQIFNERLVEQFDSPPFRMGIGLNSGTVMSGNVGSERRLEYTAIGDTVNTASRIEGLTKGTPHQLLLADSTRHAFTREHGALIEIGAREIRGRQRAVELWSTPAATDDDALPEVRSAS